MRQVLFRKVTLCGLVFALFATLLCACIEEHDETKSSNRQDSNKSRIPEGACLCESDATCKNCEVSTIACQTNSEGVMQAVNLKDTNGYKPDGTHVTETFGRKLACKTGLCEVVDNRAKCVENQ